MKVYSLRFIALTLAIVAGGWLGMKLAASSGYGSPLWPPAGLALAALLIWGRNLWPAIVLGAMVNNLLVGGSLPDGLNQQIILSSFLISCGSALQALVATHLSESRLGRGVPHLESPGKILTFFFATAPLANVIAASCGVASLVVLGVLPESRAATAWFNWWVGDSLGVIIVTPLAFCFGAAPREIWRARRQRVALPLMAMLLLLGIVFSLVFRHEKARIQLAFDNQVIAIDRLLIENINNILDNTLALKDLFSSSEQIDRHEFAMFAQAVLARHPEIQALEWLPRVSREELPQFEAKIRAEGFRDFRVTEKAGDGSLQAVLPREEYFPVTYVEPLPGNEKAFGLDSISNPLSRQSKEAARLSGHASISQRLLLIQNQQTQPAVLLSAPVYQPTDGETIDKTIAGFVTAVIVPTRVVDSALQGLNFDNFNLRIIDRDAPAEEALLFEHEHASQSPENLGLVSWRHSFAFADRQWEIQITPIGSFVSANGSTLPWLTLFGGLGFTGLLSLLLLTLSGRTENIEHLIEERTEELAKANAELQITERTLRESETRLKTLIESQPECVKLLSREGQLLEMNRAGLNMIGAESFAQVQGVRAADLVLPDYVPAFEDSIERVFAGESVTLEFEIQNLKGDRRWLETHAVPMHDSDGNIVAQLGLTRDITERKKVEESLRLAARVFGEAHEGIVITDADTTIIDVNPTFCDITGYSREEIIGQKPSLLQSGKHSQEFYRDLWATLAESRHWQGEVWNRKKSGELFAELLTISALCDEQGRILHYVGLFSDITESKQQQHMLELLAHYDPLTQLPNRTLFHDRLLQAIARSRREKSLLAICFLDLDGFKPVNDQFGHDTGDRVLTEVAERIRHTIRGEDSVSRHGGDEFTLLLTDMHSLEECEQAIQRVHQAIAAPIVINGQNINIGASSGFTIFPLDESDPDTLLRHADHAMYQAKLAGKDRYHRFDPSLDQQVIDKHNQLRELEAAFDEHQFCLFYQPKVNLATGQVIGAEALIRWLHPERGLIPPLAFLPAMASDELEIRVGNWVIEQAWQQINLWHQQGLTLEVSVNISAYHLLWSGFIDHLDSVLAKSPLISSRYLQLEILESTALDDLSAVNRVLKICRDAMGVTTALDDFGTGYSSLAHLRHLPADTVKIDKGFVHDMLDDPDDYAIVESVIGLSHAFRREVIAEGMESCEQGTVLLLLGCHLAQGYAIAKPMPAEQLAEWTGNYQSHPEWQAYAGLDLTAEQTLLAIRRVDLRHWLQRVERCLSTNRNSQTQWPIMDSARTHFGRWLRQAHYHYHYDKQWLADIGELHRQLLRQGNIMMHQFWEGETDAARTGLADLQSLYRKLEQHLSEYT